MLCAPSLSMLRLTVRVCLLAFCLALALFFSCTSSLHAQGDPAPWSAPDAMPQSLTEAQRVPVQESFTTLQNPLATEGSGTLADWVRLAFLSRRDGNWEIYTARADGSNQVRLTYTPGDESRPRISPDNQWIAYDMDTGDDPGSEILIVPVAGGEPIVFIDTPARAPRQGEPPVGDFAPAWSPDGQNLAFVSTRDGNAEIYLYKLATDEQERITFNALADYDPAWNPADNAPIWARAVDTNRGVIYMKPPGLEEYALSGAIPRLEGPQFDATGTRLAYTADVNNDGLSDSVDTHPDGIHSITHGFMRSETERVHFRFDTQVMSFAAAGFGPEVAVWRTFGVIHSKITEQKLDEAWRVTDNELINNTGGNVDFGTGPNTHADLMMHDWESPTLSMTIAPGIGTKEETRTPIHHSDSGGAGVIALQVEFITEEEGKTIKMLHVNIMSIENPQLYCGYATIRVRALDAAGHTSNWAETSSLVHQGTHEVLVTDSAGVPLEGLRVTNVALEFVQREAAIFGPTITDIVGRAIHYSCFPSHPFLHVDDANWEQLAIDYMNPYHLQLVSTIGRAFHDIFDDSIEELLTRWTMDVPPKPCYNELLPEEDADHCYRLSLIEDRAEPLAEDRIVSAQTTRTLAPQGTYNQPFLLIDYRTNGIQPNTPITVTVQTSAWQTPTTVYTGFMPQVIFDYKQIVQPLPMPLGAAITITISALERAQDTPSLLNIHRVTIASRWTPVVTSITSAESATTASLDATQAFTITGENFVAPVAVHLGTTTAANVVVVDAQTLLATFNTPLPPGLHTLYVTNRAGQPEATRGGIAGAYPSQIRAWLPLMQYRGTQLHTPSQ